MYNLSYPKLLKFNDFGRFLMKKPSPNGVKVSQLGWKFHSSPEPNFKKIEPNGAKVSQFEILAKVQFLSQFRF